MFDVVAAHQPNFFPHLGFFDKMKKANVLVIRDEVLFVERDFHHRNRIRINGHDNENDPKSTWIGVSVEKAKEYIRNIRIKDGKRGKRYWRDQLLYDLSVNYRSSEYFEDFFPGVEEIVRESSLSLIDLNMDIIRFMADELRIKTPIIMASELGLKPRKYDGKDTDASEDLAAICKELQAKAYLSGIGARAYLNPKAFDRHGLHLKFQRFTHPVYRQNFPGFLQNMSAIDALFCTGGFPGEFNNYNDRYTTAIATYAEESKEIGRERKAAIGAS